MQPFVAGSFGGKKIRYIDLFCGIGGFRVAAMQVFEKYGIDSECVFSCDIDSYAREAYYGNFGERPAGDLTKIETDSIPAHDLLFAGFPCHSSRYHSFHLA